MTEHQTPAEVATAFITAFGNRDMKTVERYLADDVVFESPRVRLFGAHSVLKAVGQFAQAVIDVHVIAVLGDTEQAVVVYDMRTGPFGTLRAVDYLIIREGKIKSDVLVFDTYSIREAEEAQTPPG